MAYHKKITRPIYTIPPCSFTLPNSGSHAHLLALTSKTTFRSALRPSSPRSLDNAALSLLPLSTLRDLLSKNGVRPSSCSVLFPQQDRLAARALSMFLAFDSSCPGRSPVEVWEFGAQGEQQEEGSTTRQRCKRRERGGRDASCNYQKTTRRVITERCLAPDR